MKRRYKLIIIIIIGIITTIIINSLKISDKVFLTTLGDGFSLGMTPYNVAGKSYNDYLKELFSNDSNLESYNYEFAEEHLTAHMLNEIISSNKKGKYTSLPIKQILAKSNLITISIGLNEFAEKSILEKIDKDTIDSYLNEINILFSSIRKFYQKDIIFIGLYPAVNFKKSDAIEVNSKLKILCGKYNINFLDIIAISLKEDYYLEKSNYYLNYKAHEQIGNLLYDMYKNNNQHQK